MLKSVAVVAVDLTVGTFSKVVIVQRTSALEAFKTFLVIISKLSRHFLSLKHLSTCNQTSVKARKSLGGFL